MLERYSYLAFVFIGIIAPVHGLAMPYLIANFSLSLGIAGLLFFAGSLGYITASSTYPLLQRRISVRRLLLIGAVLTALSLAALPVMPLWALALVAAYLTGVGSGVIEVGFNALIAGLEPDRAKPAMNWLHFAFSIGALSGPIVMSRLTAWTGQWMILYWSGAILFVLFSGLWHQAQLPPSVSAAQNNSNAGNERILASLQFWLLLISMFIYVGAEVALAGWIPTFLNTERSIAVDTAAIGVSVLWAGLTVGRAICSKLSSHFDTRTLLIILCSGSAVSTALTASVQAPWLLFLWIFLTGLFFSAIFPTIMLHGTALFPHAPGEVTGGLVTAAGIGALVVPALLGFVAEYASLAAGILIVAVMFILSVLLVVPLPAESLLKQRRNP